MKTVVWMLFVTLAMALLWEPLSEALLRLALLPLCLPFNFALLGSIAFFGWLHRRGLCDERIPIDWASSTPAQIRVFTAQKEIADGCWDKIKKADPEQSQPQTERSLQLPAKVNLKVNPE